MVIAMKMLSSAFEKRSLLTEANPLRKRYGNGAPTSSQIRSAPFIMPIIFSGLKEPKKTSKDNGGAFSYFKK